MATAVSSGGVNAELFNRAIGDVTNQLTQLVAHGIGSSFGAATASTTSGSTTVGPFTWIINNPQNGGVQFIPRMPLIRISRRRFFSDYSANVTSIFMVS